MKKTLLNSFAIVLFLFVLVGSALSAQFDASPYKAGEVQVDTLAVSDTSNLKDYDFAGGIGVTYWHWQTAGVGAELKTFNTDHAAFDNIGLNLATRYPLKFVTPYAKLGFDWNAEQVGPRSELSTFEVYASVGVEKRFDLKFAKNVSVGAEVRGVRAATLAPQERAQFLVRVGKAF